MGAEAKLWLIFAVVLLCFVAAIFDYYRNVCRRDDRERQLRFLLRGGSPEEF